MQFVVILVIALVGLVASRVLENRRRRSVQNLIHASQAFVERTHEVDTRLLDDVARAVRTIDLHPRNSNTSLPTLIQIAERVIYTQRTVKTLFDPSSSLSFTISMPEKILAVGVEIDPSEFMVMLKEKERNRAIADFSDALHAQLREGSNNGVKTMVPAENT